MSVGLEFRGEGVEDINSQSVHNKRRNSMIVERQESLNNLDGLSPNDLSQ